MTKKQKKQKKEKEIIEDFNKYFDSVKDRFIEGTKRIIQFENEFLRDFPDYNILIDFQRKNNVRSNSAIMSELDYMVRNLMKLTRVEYYVWRVKVEDLDELTLDHSDTIKKFNQDI